MMSFCNFEGVMRSLRTGEVAGLIDNPCLMSHQVRLYWICIRLYMQS